MPTCSIIVFFSAHSIIDTRFSDRYLPFFWSTFFGDISGCTDSSRLKGIPCLLIFATKKSCSRVVWWRSSLVLHPLTGTGGMPRC